MGNVKEVNSFADKIFTVTYDTNRLKIGDFDSQTKNIDTIIGTIQDSDIEIISHSNGIIKFKISRVLTTNKVYSGVITIVNFISKIDW